MFLKIPHREALSIWAWNKIFLAKTNSVQDQPQEQLFLKKKSQFWGIFGMNVMVQKSVFTRHKIGPEKRHKVFLPEGNMYCQLSRLQLGGLIIKIWVNIEVATKLMRLLRTYTWTPLNPSYSLCLSFILTIPIVLVLHSPLTSHPS